MRLPEAGPRSVVALARAAQGGSTVALELLIERIRPRLLDRIRLMLGQRARRVAESIDFLQDVCLEVTRSLPRLRIDDERAFLRWATEVARNNIRQSVRGHREDRFAALTTSLGLGMASVSHGPDRMAILCEEQHRLAEYLEGLDDHHRSVIELRDFEGLSYRAIGERMGRSENAVQLLHTRAVVQLGASLRTVDAG